MFLPQSTAGPGGSGGARCPWRWSWAALSSGPLSPQNKPQPGGGGLCCFFGPVEACQAGLEGSPLVCERHGGERSVVSGRSGVRPDCGNREPACHALWGGGRGGKVRSTLAQVWRPKRSWPGTRRRGVCPLRSVSSVTADLLPRLAVSGRG